MMKSFFSSSTNKGDLRKDFNPKKQSKIFLLEPTGILAV